QIYLTLHTKGAYSLFNGSWEYHRMGLLQFARLMHKLCLAARQDDPYAEMFLLKTYDNILAMKQRIKSIETHCEQALKAIKGFEITVFSNPKVHKMPLNFRTSFAYLGANLLTDLDYTLRQAHTLKQVGILLPKDKLPTFLIPEMHRLFASSRKWHYSGITRKDIFE